MIQNLHAMRDAVSASGDLGVDWGPQGLQITDGRPRPCWGRITGVAAATNRYSWTQINESDSTLPDLGSGFAQSGTTTVGQWPAYEVTGNTLVSVGTKVMLWPSPSGQFWIFFFPTAITVGGLTVSEVDLAPSYTSITTVRFDQADGFVVSQPAAGIARIDQTPASATTVGYVTTGAQTFAGVKTFRDDAYFQGTTGAGRIGAVNSITADSDIETNTALQAQFVYGYPASTGIWRHVLNDNLDDGSGDWALAVNSDAAYADTTDRTVTLFGGTSGTHPGELEINGIIQFKGMADASAPNSSLYYSTTANKLVYKDGGGTVQALW